MQPGIKQPPLKQDEQVTMEDCLLTLLRGIQSHSVIAAGSDGREFRAELSALEIRLKGKDNAHQLVDSAVESVPGIQGSAERLNKLEEQIRAISTGDDLEVVKARLCADIAMARAEALQERRKISELFSEVVGKLDLAPAQAPGEAPRPGSTVQAPDQLTGLPGRAYAEGVLRRAHAQSADCYLALFVVKRLALINAKFGYARGDQVLLKVVVHLAQALPEYNTLFRWAPCAFLTVTPPNTAYKDLRSKIQVIELTRMAPTLEWEGRSAMVPVSLNCRIVSVKDFRTPSDLFLRLDTLAADV